MVFLLDKEKGFSTNPSNAILFVGGEKGTYFTQTHAL
jgi:hypothetical protein